MIATAVNSDGHSELLGLGLVSGEDGASWLAFLRGLKARGLDGVKLTVSDSHEGLTDALATVLDGGELGSAAACTSFAELSDLIQQENRRMAARAVWTRYFNDIDVFLCPANFTPAFPHDTRPFEERTVTTPEGDRPYDNQASGYRTRRCRACPP